MSRDKNIDTFDLKRVSVKVAQKVRKVYFTPCSLLVQELFKSRKGPGAVSVFEKTVHVQCPLIIDDIGYVHHDRLEVEVLFTLLADRYERGSVMSTGNLPFFKWEQIFKDPMVTVAAIDRLAHHNVILELNIESCGMEAAMKNRSKQLMIRQRALNWWILGNGNLWAGQRSLLVGHSGKPFFRQIKDRRRNMEQTVYIPQ